MTVKTVLILTFQSPAYLFPLLGTVLRHVPYPGLPFTFLNEQQSGLLTVLHVNGLSFTRTEIPRYVLGKL